MPRTVQPREFHPSSNLSPRSPVKLRLHRKLGPRLTGSLADCLRDLPQLTGNPIRIRFEPELTNHRGKLLSRQPGRGCAVYAASFIRKREVVLETELLNRPRLLRLIVIHELFHFVWTRLGNKARNQFAGLLADEYRQGVRGELGESAGVKKSLLDLRDCPASSKRWRDYVCESFCDTAAWRYSRTKQKGAFSLGVRWRKRREAWFKAEFADCSKC